MPITDVTPATPVINLKNLTKQFGHDDTEFFAIDNIDLVIEKGEFVAIMGPSGSGKTTLLNILGLLDTPSDGEYHLDGTSVADINHRNRARIRATRIGFVFQNFNVLHRMNVIENVALPLIYNGHGRTNCLQVASEMLKTFHLQEREYYMPYQLSGGQLQRVAIARALVNQPAIILADEPTGNLDSKSSEIIMSELSDIHKRGNTIIMVTHNPELIVHADRVIQMFDGKIASDTKHPKAEPDPTAKRPLSKAKKKSTPHANEEATEDKVATKIESKTETEAEVETEGKPESKTEVKIEDKVKSQVEAEAEPKAESETADQTKIVVRDATE